MEFIVTLQIYKETFQIPKAENPLLLEAGFHKKPKAWR